MNIWLQIAIMTASIFLGGLLVDLFRRSSHLKLLLSFSGGFLLTLIFVHILPDSYEETPVSTGYFILLGFLLQLTLEYFSRGAEHGHTHVHGHELKRVFPLAIFLSLSVHAFIETIPLSAHGHEHVNSLYWGIFLHKVPVAVALKTIFTASGYTNRMIWFYLFLFSLVAPFGMLFGTWFTEMSPQMFSWMLAVTVGMLIHISTTIIFESSESHRINFLKLVFIMLGFGTAALLTN